MWMRHRLEAQPAFHRRWVQRAGMRSQGGRPVTSSASVSGSGFHKKQPSAGRVTAHPNKGDPAWQVSRWAE
eukprot:7327440-Pyramimonas_sp.AAC.1